MTSSEDVRRIRWTTEIGGNLRAFGLMTPGIGKP
jgi:hypothetical protein